MVLCPGFYMCLVFCSCSAVVIGHLLLSCSQFTLECDRDAHDDCSRILHCLSHMSCWGKSLKTANLTLLTVDTVFVLLGDAHNDCSRILYHLSQMSCWGKVWQLLILPFWQLTLSLYFWEMHTMTAAEFSTAWAIWVAGGKVWQLLILPFWQLTLSLYFWEMHTMTAAEFSTAWAIASKIFPPGKKINIKSKKQVR